MTQNRMNQGRRKETIETKSAQHIMNSDRKKRYRAKEIKKKQQKQTKPCEVHKLINGNKNHPTLQKHNRKQIHFCLLSVANGAAAAVATEHQLQSKRQQ